MTYKVSPLFQVHDNIYFYTVHLQDCTYIHVIKWLTSYLILASVPHSESLVCMLCLYMYMYRHTLNNEDVYTNVHVFMYQVHNSQSKIQHLCVYQCHIRVYNLCIFHCDLRLHTCIHVHVLGESPVHVYMYMCIQ